MVSTTTVRVTSDTIHIGAGVPARKQEHAPHVEHASVDRTYLNTVPVVTLRERIVFGAALGVLVLGVCDAIAQIFAQGGLPRSSAWYQILVLVLATALLAVEWSRVSQTTTALVHARKVSLRSGASVAVIALYAYGFIGLVLRLPGAPVILEVSIILLGLSIASNLFERSSISSYSKKAQQSVSAEPMAHKRDASTMIAPSAPSGHAVVEEPVAPPIHEVTAPKSDPASVDVLVLDARVSEGEVLWLVACLEAHAHQPRAKVILDEAHKRHIHLKHVDQFSHHGETLHGIVEGRKLVVRIADHDDRYPEVRTAIAQGKKVLMVDQNGTTVGAVALH